MFELVFVCQNQDDIIGDALMELDALSVSVEDANAFTDKEQEIFAEPGMQVTQSWFNSRITALFNNQQQAQFAWQQLLEHKLVKQTDFIVLQQVEQQDWVRLTQAQFKPVQIVDDFWIVPSWSQAPENAQQVIELDPGLAFGTGTHPTTKMCLQWLARNVIATNTVLDYGCGSGILAIAAAKFGASKVVAVDIDPVAVSAAQDNASNNKVNIQTGLPDIVQGKFDVVVANILATPLQVLAPLLVNYLAVGGKLILAGILARQQQELEQAYAPYIQLNVSAQTDGWILMTATK